MKNCIKVGSDFSGVGAFNQSLKRLEINYEEIFACDMDKYARQTFIHNYGEPKYYPTNVYVREIPKESLDIYMTSPPCQAFSLAGKRLGKDDKRGILFFNSLEFIQINKPRFFIFENVKGLLSDDGGKTFSEWVNLLGGKSINGNTTLFPFEESVPYHLYWQVLNAKNYGVPQNRERVFLIGIRDDSDNNFRFPIEEKLNKKLKDVLENEVDEKYFLSEKLLNGIIRYSNTEGEIANVNKGRQSGQVFSENSKYISTLSACDYKMPKSIEIKSATSKGYEEATEGDSINFSVPNSKTRRGRVVKQVAQTLDTACNQGVLVGDYRNDESFRCRKDGNAPTIMARAREDKFECPMIKIFEFNNKRLNETLKKNKLPNKEVIIDSYNKSIHEESICITTRINSSSSTHLWDTKKIRRLTPRECFRLMDFPDTFTWPVSDSQAYKQAGNSIVVNVLAKIIERLPL